jgi:hypothetical protein
VLRYI